MYKQLPNEDDDQKKSRLQKEKRELENKESNLPIDAPEIVDKIVPQIFEYENDEEEIADEFHSNVDKEILRKEIKKKRGRPSKRRE